MSILWLIYYLDIFEHDLCITIHPDRHSLYVYISDIFVLCLTICCMTALLLHDCMSPVRVGRTSIPLSPTL